MNGIELSRFKLNFTETSSLGSNWQYARIVSDNDLAPNRLEAIIKTMMTQLRDAYTREELGGDGLTHWEWDKMEEFRRRHSQVHFLELKCYNFDSNLTEVCSQGSN